MDLPKFCVNIHKNINFCQSDKKFWNLKKKNKMMKLKMCKTIIKKFLINFIFLIFYPLWIFFEKIVVF